MQGGRSHEDQSEWHNKGGDRWRGIAKEKVMKSGVVGYVEHEQKEESRWLGWESTIQGGGANRGVHRRS